VFAAGLRSRSGFIERLSLIAFAATAAIAREASVLQSVSSTSRREPEGNRAMAGPRSVVGTFSKNYARQAAVVVFDILFSEPDRTRRSYYAALTSAGVPRRM